MNGSGKPSAEGRRDTAPLAPGTVLARRGRELLEAEEASNRLGVVLEDSIGWW
jgi:hypothetical protein